MKVRRKANKNVSNSRKKIKVSQFFTDAVKADVLYFMELLTEFLSSPCRMFALFFTATFIGMSKTGMQGINTITIPIMALAFGAKPSTGVILPMLCFADLIAVIYYRRAAEWRYVLGLLPAAVAGFFLAIAVDKFVPAGSFGILMAFCIFLGLVVMFWTERGGVKSSFVDKWWYGPAFGLMGGFTTMIGNAAGPVMSVYLLSTRLPKYAFVGTAAWFFLLVNYMKIPLQVFVWDNITLGTLAIDALAIPFIFIGAVFGIWLVKKLPESKYRAFIIATTVLSTLMLLF